jgi:uncharacterized membrane protein
MNPATLLLPVSAGAFLILGSGLYLTPEMSRSNIFFSVTVPNGFRETETAKLALKRYRRAVALAAAAAFGLTLAVSANRRLLPFAMIAGTILEISAGIAAFSRAHARILPFSQPLPSVREATLAMRRTSLSQRWWAWASPIVFLLGVGAYLMEAWNRLPARYPTHWNFRGRPDHWAARSAGHVLLPVILGLVLCAFICASAYWMDRFSRRPADNAPAAASERRYRAAVSGIILSGEYLLAFSLGVPALAPLLPLRLAQVLLQLLPLIALGATAAIIAACVRLGRLRQMDPLAFPTDLTPDACWKAGLFYVNPNDSSLIVEKRSGIGYTLNLAHPGAWAILAAIALLPLAALILVRR